MGRNRSDRAQPTGNAGRSRRRRTFLQNVFGGKTAALTLQFQLEKNMGCLFPVCPILEAGGGKGGC